MQISDHEAAPSLLASLVMLEILDILANNTSLVMTEILVKNITSDVKNTQYPSRQKSTSDNGNTQ